ncbi:unnamed protein product, partial [Heterosigma akashiwo]
VIESAQNNNLKLIRGLQRTKRKREKQGKIVLEGFKLLKECLDVGLAPSQVLFSSDIVDTSKGVEAIELVERAGAQILVAKDNLVKECCETKNPQGVLSIISKPELHFPQHPSLLLILDNLNDPGNMGTLIRTAASVGVEGVILLGNCCDPWSSKALRSSMGSIFRVPLKHNSNIRDFQSEYKSSSAGLMKIYAADGYQEKKYYDIDWKQPSALIVGSEASGLHPDIRAQMANCGRGGEEKRSKGDEQEDLVVEGISIPLFNGVESLNAGVAGSIILGEVLRQRNQQQEREKEK